jgi:transcription-repair coupling factor (superfamily II helicase)
MRGRVGRSNKKAFCYLLVPSMASLTQESRKRLQTLEEFSDLGDGFKVAMRDLDIRGAGNLLGSEQSGFINDLGFETYHKILDEAIQELKETEFRELFSTEISTKKLVRDCVIETDLQLLIPDDYVKSISERLSLYNQLDNIKTDEELVKFTTEIQDRFGNIPVEVLDLVEVVRLRWLAVQIGFEKLSIKNAVMRGFFTTINQKEYFQSDIFGKVIVFVQNHAKTVRLREINKKQMLIFDEITTISNGITSLKGILGNEM